MQSKKIVEKLCRAMYYQESPRGETLIRTGAIPDKFYVLMQGEVIVVKRRDPFKMESDTKLYYKVRNVISQIYANNIIPGDQLKVNTLAVPRHGFDDEEELAVLRTWDYSKKNFEKKANFFKVKDGKLYYKEPYLIDHFKGMGLKDFKTTRDIFDRVRIHPNPKFQFFIF